MKLKIQKGVPIPLKGKGFTTKVDTYRPIIAKMNIGDSFVIDEKEYFAFHNATRFAPEFKNWRFTSRRESGEVGKKRIWRIA